MKVLDKETFSDRAFRAGKHSVDCLTNREHSANVAIIHHGNTYDDDGNHSEGRVFVRMAYWRAGQLHEYFLEIPDSE